MKWFWHFGANFYRASLGVTLIFDPEEKEYAVALFAGPLMFMTGLESK
jgi:hypothetical protein